MTIMRKKYFKKIPFRLFPVTVAIILAGILIAGGWEIKARVTKRQPVTILPAEATTTPFPMADTREISPFTYLNLSAKGVIVYDISTDRVIFSQQKDDILPIASITKLMTIYTAAQILSPETKITIAQEDLDLDSSSGLVSGENWNFQNLAAFTLISSSNAGANAIAREAQNQSQVNFISQMNELAKQIGLQNTFLRNVTGLDLLDQQISGAASTAQDIAELYVYIFKHNPELLTDTNKNSISISSLDGIKHSITNTNEIIGQIPGLISSKTGTTLLAGGNLAILFNPIKNHPVAIVLLGGTPNSRFVDMRKLVKDTIRVVER